MKFQRLPGIAEALGHCHRGFGEKLDALDSEPSRIARTEVAALGKEQRNVEQGRSLSDQILRQGEQQIVAPVRHDEPQPGIEDGDALGQIVDGQPETGRTVGRGKRHGYWTKLRLLPAVIGPPARGCKFD